MKPVKQKDSKAEGQVMQDNILAVSNTGSVCCGGLRFSDIENLFQISATQATEIVTKAGAGCLREGRQVVIHWGQTPTHLDSRCLRGMFSAGRELVDKRPIKVLGWTKN
jgi:hypothetical protein